jgi:hypothetical protein
VSVSLRNLRSVTAEAVPIINRHSDELGRMQRDLMLTAKRLQEVDKLLDAHLSASFWQRLKFLVRGR